MTVIALGVLGQIGFYPGVGLPDPNSNIMLVFVVLLILIPLAWLSATLVEIVGIVKILAAGVAGRLGLGTLVLWLLQILAILAGIVVASHLSQPGSWLTNSQELDGWLLFGAVATPPLLGMTTLGLTTILFLYARRELARRASKPDTGPTA